MSLKGVKYNENCVTGYSSVAAPPEGTDSQISTKPLSEYALLLLLILTNHCTDTSTLANPYRDVLFQCANNTESSSSSSKGEQADNDTSAGEMRFAKHLCC